MNRKVPRKTMREVRLEERVRGFYECLHIFEDLWRKKGHERLQFGLTMKAAFEGPVIEALWEGIEAAQAKISPIDSEYKDIRHERCYGPESAVDQLAEVGRNARD